MKSPFLFLPAAAALVWGAAAVPEDEAGAPAPSGSLDHSRLLFHPGPQGEPLPVRTPEDWRARRALILKGMQEVMGPLRLPPRKERAVDFKVEEEVTLEAYTRRRITFAARSSRVPAYLLVPRSRKGRVPAVLCLHQTTSLGKGEPAGVGGTESLQYGARLAERGLVTLAPDYPGFGDHKLDVYSLGYQSGTMKAIEDNMQAIDLLESLPEVDPGAIGAMGHSLGGHNALFTAAFDERIRVVVSSCGFTAFGRYYGGNLTGWSSRTYMPRIPSYGGWRSLPFDFHEVVGALAPRPFLAVAPRKDSNFDWKGVQEVLASAREVYRFLRAEERLLSLSPDCGHEFPASAREEAFRLIEKSLRP